MTSQEYLDFTDKASNTWLDGKLHLRKGQACMMTLQEVFPKIYKEVIGTYSDCFYNDGKILAMLNVLIKKIE